MKIENCKYQEILDTFTIEIVNLKIILLKMTNNVKRIDWKLFILNIFL